MAAVIAGAMMLPAIACSHGSSNNNSQGNSAPENSNIAVNDDGMLQYNLEFNNLPQEQNAGGEEQAEDVFIVTTMRGEDGKSYVAKTDINGTTVTESNGEVATEVYTGTTLATTYAKQDYKPSYKNYQAFWLDMSQKADFVFDGELLKLEIEIPSDAVDGVYPVQFYFADIANWDANTLYDVTMNVGYVCINTAAPAADQPTGSALTINPGIVTAKPGDTVMLPINIVNNPGFVGFRLRMRYDSNAMKIVDAGAGADLHSKAGMTAREIGDSGSN